MVRSTAPTLASSIGQRRAGISCPTGNEGLPADFTQCFEEMVALLRQIELWWIVNVEIPTNPNLDGEEIDESGIFQTSTNPPSPHAHLRRGLRHFHRLFKALGPVPLGRPRPARVGRAGSTGRQSAHRRRPARIGPTPTTSGRNRPAASVGSTTDMDSQNPPVRGNGANGKGADADLPRSGAGHGAWALIAWHRPLRGGPWKHARSESRSAGPRRNGGSN